MPEYEKCKICGKWGFTNSHKCPPAYGVRLEDWETEEEVEVHASSTSEAAETFLAERFSDFEYPKSATVIVNDWRADHWQGKLYKYEVTVEMSPVFSAELVEEMPVPTEDQSPDAEG